MSDARRTIMMGAALGGTAAAFGWWLTRLPARPFLYVTRTGEIGPEKLRLARITGGTGKPLATARDVRTVLELPGEQPTGDVPETFTRLVPSPGNMRMAVLSTQLGLDFIDMNIRVIDLKTGTVTAFLNEHRFSGASKANCVSAVFEAFCATEAAAGTPPDVIAGYDWSIAIEGEYSTAVPWPDLAWVDDDVLIVAFKLTILENSFGDIGEEVLRFRIVPGETSWTQWTARMPPVPPAGPLSIGSAGRGNPSVIRYSGKPLPFEPAGRVPKLPILVAKTLRKARMVAGLVG